MSLILAKIVTVISLVSGVPATMPVPAAEAVPDPHVLNTLDYFISDHPDKTLKGSHNQNQSVSGNVSYYTKWSGDAYEIHSWDDRYIYLQEDRSWKYDKSYIFSSGKWMARRMAVGESIMETGNIATYYDSATCSPEYSHPLPYVATLEAHYPSFDAGGELGNQDVIVLKYDYGTMANHGNFERFYYSKEWGWVKWELYENNSLVQTSVFNEIESDPLVPSVNNSCLGKNRGTSGQVSVKNNRTVREYGTDYFYYINEKMHRQYVCDMSVLSRYGLAVFDVDVLPADEVKAYPVVKYVKFVSDGPVFTIVDRIMVPVSPAELGRAGILAEDVALADSQDYSCYRRSMLTR